MRFRTPVDRDILRKLKPEPGDVVTVPGSNEQFTVIAVGLRWVRAHVLGNARDVRSFKLTEVTKKA